jgi:pimeloyl-ACP methyl ester carboxylesterase
MSQSPGAQPQPQTQTIRHSFADVNGVRLHYASAGNPANKLILFLHGFPEFWYAWRNQLAEFGKDFHAVAPDQRGYNLSSRPAEVEEYEITKLVGDIRALIGHLQPSPTGAQRCILVAHDWGGVVAWATAIACPDLVEKLVIVNAPHPAVFQRELRENPAQQSASQYMNVFRSPEAEAMISANNFALFQEGILGDGLRKAYFTERDRLAYVEAWSQPGALTGGLNWYRANPMRIGTPSAVEGRAVDGPSPGNANLPIGASAVAPVSTTLPSFTVQAPTLVIWGEQDPYLLTGNLDGLDRFVPNLRIERIPDATHWVVHEKPQLVNSLIRSFVQS